MIPEAAVEAAIGVWGSVSGPPWERRHVHQLLEAAAPHMLAGLRELVEDMERQPHSELATVPGVAVLIRAAVGDLL